jgi:Zn-dependent protease with chaperone function
MRRKVFLVIAALVAAMTVTVTAAGFADLKDLKPGFNLFSPQQDIEVGREAAAQVAREQPIVHNSEINNYLTSLVQRLARSPHTGTEFPFSVQAISDKNINAFALPGGPLFVYTGLISLADNEAQLAGVLAHEMSHIRLRHGTSQASKANLFQLPFMLAGGLAGDGLLGQLTQLGIGLGTGSVLLRMSRTAESQADYNGAQIMAEAGYNPIEMAQLFEKLEAQQGQARSAQFLSDHPNPGNRIKAVQEEIQQMPRRSYATDTRQFAHIKDVVTHLAPPTQLRGQYNDGHTAPQAPNARPTKQSKQYQGRAFTFDYPDNWQIFGDPQSAMVTIAPSDGVVRGRNGNVSIGYGAIVSYYFPQSDEIQLRRDTDKLRLDTDDLVRQMQQSNPEMRAAEPRGLKVNGYAALVTTLNANSPFQGETEIDQLVTVNRPEGLWYLVFISPQSESRDIQPIFDQMLRSVRFSR